LREADLVGHARSLENPDRRVAKNQRELDIKSAFP
jgi:hypothetical protein